MSRERKNEGRRGGWWWYSAFKSRRVLLNDFLERDGLSMRFERLLLRFDKFAIEVLWVVFGYGLAERARASRLSKRALFATSRVIITRS